MPEINKVTPPVVTGTPPTAAAKFPVGQNIDIGTLEQKFGWAAGGWQDKLLQAADQGGKKDGLVSVKELDAYLAQPKDLKFLTSSAMVEAETSLAAKGGTERSAAQFPTGWQRSLANTIDKSSFGNKDGKVSSDEMKKYFDAVKTGTDASLPLWLPDQKVAMLDSKVSDLTGEADLLKTTGKGATGTQLLKEYMRISLDEQKRVPQMVSYMLTASDIKETPVDVERKNNFHIDPDTKAGSSASDFAKTGYDKGHMKAADDSPTMEAMNESFLMTNMAPQTGNMNRQGWRTLEQATNELVRATGGKATIVTGNLYLNEKGQPLSPDKMQWIGRNGEPRVAVPTHSFKAVLLQLPNGNMTMFAYQVPNKADLPTHKPEIGQMLAESRVSVDRLEQLLGADLFSALPKDVQDKLEKDPAAKMTFDNAGQYHAASLLWPQPTPATPKS